MDYIAKVGDPAREKLQYICRAFRLKGDVIIYRRIPNVFLQPQNAERLYFYSTSYTYGGDAEYGKRK